MKMHEKQEYRLQKTVAGKRNSIEYSELDELTWIRDLDNTVYALMKRNMTTWKKLSNIITNGVINIQLETVRSHIYSEWK